MKKSVLLFIALNTLFSLSAQKGKLEMDKEAIRKMAGCYKVTFAFSETFAPDTSYVYHDKKFDWGIELVKLIEETPTKIVLQHLLIVNDTMIIKHWRQDWVYENRDLLVYDKESVWKNIQISKQEAAGTWTQKVFQVDDSPRYEGYGTWVHVDGRHFWEAKADAPLPRREHTKRSDYNVMARFSHIELFEDGWALEQDNQKIIRTDNTDQLLCEEKGMERFYVGDYNCASAEAWWIKNERFWKIARETWTSVLAKGTLTVKTKNDKGLLFMRLFELGDEVTAKNNMTDAQIKEEISKVVNEHLSVQK